MKHVDHLIQAYCDDELDPSRRAAFEAHVGACEACRAELEATRGLWAAVDGAARPAAAAEVWPAVAARIAGRARPAGWTRTQRGLAVAATLAGVAIGFGLGSGGVADQDGADTASADYLEENLPTLDQLWLQLGGSNEDAGS